MALRVNEPNPLGTLGMRKLSFVPEHFTSSILENIHDSQKILQWIEYNLNSRYAITRAFKIGHNGAMIEGLRVGFEDPSEMSIFMLSCPYTKK